MGAKTEYAKRWRLAKLAADPDFRKKEALKRREWRARHAEKVSEMNAKRRAADPEKAKRESREWFARNKDKRALYQQNRRRRAFGRLSPGLRQTLKEKQQGLCVYCKVDLNTVDTHLDHILPLILGGLNEDSNMQLLCWLCNCRKHTKHPDEFRVRAG